MSESAAKNSNYEISINGTIIPGATIIEDIVVDGKTALIRLNEGSSLPSSHQFRLGDKIVVQTTDAITSADGTVLPRYSSEEIVYNVTTAPTVKNVAIDRTAGSESLTIEFDRPVDTTVDLVKIDGISLTNATLVAVDDTIAGNYSYTFDISLSANGAVGSAPALTQSQLDSIKEKGNHEVTIFALTDTASANPAVNAAVNATYTVSEDTTAPKVISVTAVNGNKFFVETNRAVTLDRTAIKVEKGTHEFSNASSANFANPAAASASEVVAAPGTRNGKPGIYVAIKEAPTTDENPLYKGTETTASLKVTLENYKANDLIGTKYVGNVSLTKDTVKPKVKTNELVSANQMTVTFEKPVTQVNTLANDEVVVRDKDGVVLSTTVSSVTGDTLTIASSAAFATDKGPFTVEIAANELYYNETTSSVAAYQATSLRNDKLTTIVRPSESGFKYVEFVNGSSTSDLDGVVTQTTAAGKNVITIDYKTEMTDSAKLASNYKLDGKALPAGTVVDFVGDKENVHITLPKEAVKADGSFLLEISTNVTTESGSKVVKDLQTRTPYTTTVVLADDTKPVLKEAVFIKASNASTTSDVIKLTFTEDIANSVTATNAVKNLEVTINGSKQNVSIAASELSDGDNEVVITLPSAVSLTTVTNIKTVADENGDVFIVDSSSLANKLQIGTTVVADGSKAEIDLDAIADQSLAQATVNSATVNGATTTTVPGVTANLALAGADVTWSSSNTAVITDAGLVTRPAFADGNATVTLTATATVNGQTASKDFTITVTAEAASNVATLDAVVGKYSIGGSVGSETLTADGSVTTVGALKAALDTTHAAATVKVTAADGTTELTDATALASGQKVIVTAEDATATVTYVIQ